MKISKSSVYLSLVVWMWFSLNGCSYYMTNLTFEPDYNEITTQANLGKIILLHNGFNPKDTSIEIWKISNIKLDESGELLIARGVVDNSFVNHLTTEYLKPNPYSEENSEVIKEVHLYAKEVKVSDDVVTVRLKDLERMEVYDRDRKTENSKTLSGVLGVISLIFMMGPFI